MKTIELLNKAVELGFSREKALADIDASLDEVIGAENRKPIAEEEISEELANDISFYLCYNIATFLFLIGGGSFLVGVTAFYLCSYYKAIVI